MTESHEDAPPALAGLLVLTALGVPLYAGFAVIEDRMTFWAKTRPKM